MNMSFFYSIQKHIGYKHNIRQSYWENFGRPMTHRKGEIQQQCGICPDISTSFHQHWKTKSIFHLTLEEGRYQHQKKNTPWTNKTLCGTAWNMIGMFRQSKPVWMLDIYTSILPKLTATMMTWGTFCGFQMSQARLNIKLFILIETCYGDSPWGQRWKWKTHYTYTPIHLYIIMLTLATMSGHFFCLSTPCNTCETAVYYWIPQWRFMCI